MLDSITKRRIDSSRDILVGKIPDPKSQVEQITIALIYKFMDDMDRESEELGGKRHFFTGDLEKYAWSTLMSAETGGYQLLSLYGEAIEKFQTSQNLPQLFRDIFKNAFLPYRDPETLRLFLKTINDFTYEHSEQLGNAFEYLLSVLGSQGDAGQFLTPRHIIDFMVEAVEPRKDDRILDPACGTAGFLISAYKYILKQNAKDGKDGAALLPDEKSKLLNNIVGYDIAPDMVRLSRVNMYLHGFPTPQIAEYDTLTSEDKWNEYYDVIMANPPFMSPKGGIIPHQHFSVQAKRSEVLFVDYIAEHLLQNGRAGVIVPEGVIFQSGNAYKALRKVLVDNYLYAVVSLPAGVFQPYSGVKTSILLMDKRLARMSDSILFVKVENDGFDLGAQRKQVAGSDLTEALKAITEYKQAALSGKAESSSALGLVVKKSQIAENGEYNLSVERYRIVDTLCHKWSMVALGEVCAKITDGSHHSPATTNEGIPYITVRDLHDGIIDFTQCKYISSDDYKLLVNNGCRPFLGDVLFSKDGTVGKVAKVNFDKEFGVLSSLAILTPNQEVITTAFLELLLLQDRILEQALEMKGGAAIQRIILRDIKKIQIPLPPLPVQKEIMTEVEGYQRIIDGSRQVVENYKPKIAVDPTWPRVELGEICDVRDGTHESPKYVLEGYPLITSKNIKDNTLDFSDVNLISKEDLDRINKRSKVDDGDIIMPMIGTIGNPIIVEKLNREFAIKNVALIKFFQVSKVNKHYLKHILSSASFNNQFVNFSSGSTQKFISLGYIRKLLVPLPPASTQQKIVTEIEKEQALVNASKELITLYKRKIKDKIAEVWNSE